MPKKTDKKEKTAEKKTKKITKPAKATEEKIARKKTEKKEESEEAEKEEKIKEKKITKAELEKKAKKLAEKITGVELKKKLEKEREEEKEKEKEKRKTLIPIEDYVKYGVYIGTKVITPHIRPYVYRRRNDGIAIINTNAIDKKLKEMIELLKEYAPEDFIVVCKREAGWKAVNKFSELTGVRVFTKKYPAGILTNIALPNFFETEMVFICDPWLDRNAMNDTKKIKKKIFALCDTNNYAFDIDFFVPCNNKSGKSLGLIFYILTREYLKARGIKGKIREEDFIVEE